MESMPDSFPSEILFLTGFLTGTMPAEYDLENGMETENPGILFI